MNDLTREILAVAKAVIVISMLSCSVFAQKPELIIQAEHFGTVSQVIFSPDGKLLASGSYDKTIKLWDVTSGMELRSLKGHSGYVQSVAFSPNGKLLASGSYDKTIKLWDVARGQELLTLQGHSDRVFSVAISPDGKTLASGSADCTVKLWDLSSGRELRALKGAACYSVFSVAFSPDGKSLATGSDEARVKLWDVSSGKELRTLKGPSDGLSVAFSPDGKTLASGNGGAVNVWEVSTGLLLRTLKGLNGKPVYSVAFSPDGKSLGGSSESIKLWDAATGADLQAFEEDAWRIGSVAFSPDSKFLVSTSDRTIKLWDISGAKVVRTFPETSDSGSQSEIDWLVVTPDGLFDASPASWNKILRRYGPNTFDVAPVEAFFKDYFYPGLLNDVVEGKKLPSVTFASRDLRQPLVHLSAETPANDTRTVSIRLEVAEAGADKEHPSGSGAQDARLFRNGSLVKVWRGKLALQNGKAVLEATVPIVAGENTFSTFAFNRDNIRSREESITVVGSESLRRAGKTYVLAIGIDQYSNSEFSLKYAVKDAQLFIQEIGVQQQKLDVPRHVEKFFLSNSEATKSKILETIKKISEQAQPEDVVMLYFSGHGTAKEGHYYLIPHDMGFVGARNKIDTSALRVVLSHSISDQELAQSLESIDCERLVLIIDSTHSGQLPRAKDMGQLAYEKQMFILTSSQSYQDSYESEKIGHGYLTYALMEEGLRSGQAAQSDGTVTLRGWLKYAAERVPLMVSEMRGGSAAQVPFLLLPRATEVEPFIVAKIDKGRGNVSR